MRFRLVYEGDLFSSQTQSPTHATPKELRLADHKHKIRKQFHKQIKRAFDQHPVLSNFRYCKGCQMNHGLHRPDGYPHDLQKLHEFIVASTPMSHGFQFCPLVSEILNLDCSLEILILRRDARSGVYTAGDLDNRLKTLIDGLSMPQQMPAQIGSFKCPDIDENPFFCLLRDDNIISGLKVETDVLYREEDGCGNQLGPSYVYAVIEAEVKPRGPSHLNLNFF